MSDQALEAALPGEAEVVRLVEELREQAQRFSDPTNEMLTDAADALQAMQARVKELEEALNLIDALEPEEHLFGFGVSHDACRGLVARMGETARTALKGGSNG